VKVRFTADVVPNSTTNRGWTYNPTSNTWVQEREDWTLFPIVTTDASGLLDTWIYTKFGDEDQSGSYHAMISLSKTGAASTYNSSVVPVVTVMDMKTAGAWIHNGTATGASTAKRAEVTSVASTTTVYALGKTETDLVDSDSNGVVDDEDCGPTGKNGDYRFAVPTATAFSVYLNRNYTSSTILNKTVAANDIDIALMAADTEAPSAPANLTATPGSDSVMLEWDAATDSGSGVSGYKVYRWQASPSASYTYPKSLIATPSAGVTSFLDEGLVKGEEYSYEVRAVDADTNVSPRSVEATAVPLGLMDTTRTSGTDRYATAIALSSSTFADSSVTTAVVATGRDFPDALSASSLAGVYGSPILLVGTSVTASLTAELDRLGVQDIVLIGGTSAVSETIETSLSASYDVSRVSGDDRYATSVAVASEVASLTGGMTEAFFARGDGFADALAVSPFAYGQAIPVLLVRPTSIPTVVNTAIGTLGLTDGIIVGGTPAVSAAVMSDLDGLMSGSVTRVWGTDRYLTARAVADFGVAQGWGGYGYVGVATGLTFPDALGGGPVAAQNHGVLLLTNPTTLSAPVSSAITTNKAMIDLVDIYGSESAVSAGVRSAIEALLQ
jgi:putative cell wall-binding protein